MPAEDKRCANVGVTLLAGMRCGRGAAHGNQRVLGGNLGPGTVVKENSKQLRADGGFVVEHGLKTRSASSGLLSLGLLAATERAWHESYELAPIAFS
jgi:hypothetical protein